MYTCSTTGLHGENTQRHKLHVLKRVL